MKRGRSMRKAALGRAAIVLGAALSSLAPAACGQSADEHGEDEHAEEARGPHGGQLLGVGPVELEVTIFEQGMAPEMRVYVYREGVQLTPEEIALDVELHRLGGRVDRLGFSPQGDHLRGDHPVEEPHSFDVKLSARVEGALHELTYASYEGRVELAESAREAAGIGLAAAGPASLRTTLPLNGRIVPNEDRLAHLTPRFPGVVREVRKRLGDFAAQQEVLAVVESNESLHPYELRSPVAGTVIFKEVSAGEFVSGERVVYAVADLSSVWADFYVHPPDFPRLRAGQHVTISGGAGTAPAESVLSYLSPVGSPGSQTLLARAVLPNPEALWPPGLFVRGDVVVDEAQVPVAVRGEALQRLRDWNVVFVRFGTTFEARPVAIGRRDGPLVEVTAGLEPGWTYAAENSFVLKADVEKAGASHDH
jgi:membrane fusion protein, heavy metal efflux system